MSTENTSPEAPVAPLVAAPEVAPAPVVAPPEPFTLSTDDRLSLDPAQRKGALFGATGEPAAPAAVEPVVPAEAVTPPVEPIAPVAPVVPPEPVAVIPPDDEVDKATGITKNFRLHTESAEQSAFLKAYKAASQANPNLTADDIANLARASGLKTVETPPAAVAQIPGLVQQEVPAEIATARAEIAAMEQAMDEALLEGELLTPQRAKMQRDYARKSAELSKIEMRYELAAERQAQSSQQQAMTTRQAEMQAIETEYAALKDPESDLSLELDRQFYAITANPQHPDFAKVNAEGFPAYLTEQAARAVAARMLKKNSGMTEAQALASVKGEKPAAVAPVSPVVVAPVSKPPQSNPVPRTVLVTAPGGQAAPAPVQLSIEQVRERAARDPQYRRAALGFTAERIVA